MIFAADVDICTRSIRGAAMIAGHEWHRLHGGERRKKMPTIELLAEVELLKKKLERAEHMAAQWKSLAKMHRYSIIKIYEPQLDAQLKAICELQTENAALKKHQAEDKRSNYTLCHNQLLKQLKERAEEAEGMLAALKKDARHVAKWARRHGMNDSLRDAANRILEATED
jgi:hypothetical protein